MFKIHVHCIEYRTIYGDEKRELPKLQTIASSYTNLFVSSHQGIRFYFEGPMIKAIFPDTLPAKSPISQVTLQNDFVDRTRKDIYIS